MDIYPLRGRENIYYSNVVFDLIYEYIYSMLSLDKTLY